MSDTVTLKHVNHTLPRRAEPVYDGWYEAVDGSVTLPIDNINHARALWFRGYQLTSDGQSIRNFPELDAYIKRVAAEETAPQMATEPEVETTDEGTDTGRQPDTEHRVRSRQRKSRKKTTQ